MTRIWLRGDTQARREENVTDGQLQLGIPKPIPPGRWLDERPYLPRQETDDADKEPQPRGEKVVRSFGNGGVADKEAYALWLASKVAACAGQLSRDPEHGLERWVVESAKVAPRQGIARDAAKYAEAVDGRFSGEGPRAAREDVSEPEQWVSRKVRRSGWP